MSAAVKCWRCWRCGRTETECRNSGACGAFHDRDKDDREGLRRAVAKAGGNG